MKDLKGGWTYHNYSMWTRRSSRTLRKERFRQQIKRADGTTRQPNQGETRMRHTVSPQTLPTDGRIVKRLKSLQSSLTDIWDYQGE